MNKAARNHSQTPTHRFRTGYDRVIGVDVSKDKLDVHDSDRSLTETIDNTPEAIDRSILDKLDGDRPTLILCESTANYHRRLIEAAHRPGVDLVVANPRQVRDFAKGLGRLEKTDRIDAAVICRFGQDVAVPPVRPMTEPQKTHAALVTRRQSLVKMRTAETLRKQQSDDQTVRTLIASMISAINAQIKQVDRQLAEILAELSAENPSVAVLRSHPGVGVVTTSVLITRLPELGQLNRRQVSKLVGLCPITRQSGRADRPRAIGGGRSSVRRTLYMAATTARVRDESIRRYFENLRDRGKPHNVAMVAVMRRMLCTLNVMVRNGECYDAAKTGSMSGSVSAAATA